MLEQVREPAPPAALVLRADVEPLVDVDDRQLAVDVQDDLQAVRQRVFLERTFGMDADGDGCDDAGGCGGAGLCPVAGCTSAVAINERESTDKDSRCRKITSDSLEICSGVYRIRGPRFAGRPVERMATGHQSAAIPPFDSHSCLSATIGSTRAARCAGSHEAKKAS